MDGQRLLRCKDCGTYHVTGGFLPKCTDCGSTTVYPVKGKAPDRARVVIHRRAPRGKPRREPMTVFHVLVSKSGLTVEEQYATNRLFNDGELSDVPVSKVLRTLGCAE